jgi:hypothetical protein
MTVQLLHASQQEWLRQMFGSKTAIDGGVVRRKVQDVERLVGRDTFLTLMRNRGFKVVENAGHFVVFCNAEPFNLRV